MDVSVLIVTYFSADQITACLQSLSIQTGVQFEVIVVDNASGDDTLAKLEGHNIRVVASKENLGFGRGNNLAFTQSTGRYIYIFNPDAQLVGDRALADLCEQMDAHPEWGMAGTRVLSEDGTHESPPATGYPGERHVTRDFSHLPGKIAWILGASMMIRREVYEKMEGFDPGFFLYSEETDLCLRTREAGWEIGYIPEITAKHIGGASENASDPYHITERRLTGMLRFRQKHYSPGDCVCLAKLDLRRACFRAVFNALLALFQPRPSKAWEKYRHYAAIRDITLRYLKSL